MTTLHHGDETRTGTTATAAHSVCWRCGDPFAYRTEVRRNDYGTVVAWVEDCHRCRLAGWPLGIVEGPACAHRDVDIDMVEVNGVPWLPEAHCRECGRTWSLT